MRAIRSPPLPDNDALRLGTVHGPVGDVERLEEGVDIAERGVDAVAAQRVYVELCQTRRLLVAYVLAPACGGRELAALVGGEAVDRRGLRVAEGVVQGGVGYAQTSLIGYVLT